MLPVFGWKIIEEGEQSLSILNQTLGYLQACPSPLAQLRLLFKSSAPIPATAIASWRTNLSTSRLTTMKSDVTNTS